MKFRVERGVILNAVSWVARSLNPRPPIPVIAGVKLEANTEGLVSLSTFDYNVSAECEISAEVEESGQVIVSGRLLSEIVKKLPDRPIDFESDNNSVVITCGSSRFSIMMMAIDEYPILPKMPEQIGTVDAGEFQLAISQATISASQDDTLPIIMAVRLEIEGDRISFLATDRYRLSHRDLIWNPLDNKCSMDALVGANVLNDVAKNLTSAGPITIHIDPEGGKIIGFSAGGRRTTATITDGEYPPVRQLFPKESESVVVVSTEEIMNALKRVSLVAEHGSAVRLSFNKSEVRLEAGQNDDAQATEVIPGNLDGQELVTAFRPDFLLSGLGALKTPYVRMSFVTPQKPMVMTSQKESEKEDDTMFRYLLMPLRFTN